jgi:uncharacterized protein (TIGR03118 family)
VDNSGKQAVYKALALGWADKKPYLFAANFKAGLVEVYDGDFKPVKSFSDPAIPAGFAPCGLRNFDGRLFVTFAKQKAPENEDDEAGAGNGYIDIFDTQGNFVQRFASQGTLNSPWGLAMAPKHFGKFSHALLVGNFGDGRITAFNSRTGATLGQLANLQGDPIEIAGLRGLAFGTFGGRGYGKLYFTAGPVGETHGLFGVVRPALGHHEDDDGDADDRDEKDD